MIIRKRWISTGAATAAVLLTGTAFAYWLQNFTGTGSGELTDVSKKVSIFGEDDIVLPMGETVPLEGTFSNRNKIPVSVEEVRIKVVGAYTPDGEPLDDDVCGPDDYLVTPAVGPFDVTARTPGRLGFGRWTGGTITLVNDPDRNQDGCKGAKIQIRYRAVAGS